MASHRGKTGLSVDELAPIVVYPPAMTPNPYAAPAGAPTPKPNRTPLIIAGLVAAVCCLCGVPAAIVAWGAALPESGVRAGNQLDRKTKSVIERKAKLADGEEIVVFYDTTVAVDATECAVITNHRVIYWKGDEVTDVPLDDVANFTHEEVPLTGDVFTITDTRGKVMRIEVAPFNDGNLFKGALERGTGKKAMRTGSVDRRPPPPEADEPNEASPDDVKPEGKPLDFTLRRYPDRKRFVMSSTRGQVVLIDLWATWCEPCKTSLPRVEAIEADLGPKGLTVASINIDDDDEALPDFIRELKLKAPILRDPKGEFAHRQLDLTGVPTTLLVDRAGVVRYRHLSELTDALEETVREELEELLAEPPPAGDSHRRHPKRHE